MSDATVHCPRCGHEGIVVTELLNSDLALISDSQQAEIERLEVQLANTLNAAMGMMGFLTNEELDWVCSTWPLLAEEWDE